MSKQSKTAAIFLLFILILLTTAFGQSSSRELYVEGRALQTNQKYYEAIETYKLSLIENQHYIDPMIGLAECFFALGEYSEALTWVEQAEKYNRSRSDLKNLKGRIYIGLGEYESGQNLFMEVLEKEPNNLNANFGLAELEIAEGKLASGTRMFEDTLKMSPHNRKALLTLTVILNAMERQSEAEEYIRQALHYHYEDVFTQFIAARHYSQTGRLDLAEMHAKTALGINDQFSPAKHLLGNLYLETGKYDEAEEFLKKSIAVSREDPLLWYALGFAQEKTGNIQEGITSYQRALKIKPDDEITRLALEQLLSGRLELETPARKTYSDYHLQKGKEFEERNLYSKALAEYRRALKIAPFDKENRIAYAEIFMKMGFPGKYLSELKVIEEQHEIGSDIADAIEIQESLQEDTLARKWNIDQFSSDTQKHVYNVALFVYPDKNDIPHFQGERVILTYLSDLLLHFENIEVKESRIITTFSQGFRSAREMDTDYFILLYPQSGERVFNVRADLFASDTGGMLRTFTIMRTGNDKVSNAMLKLVEQLHDDLEPTGHLLERKFDTVLINLGRMEHVEEEQLFHIVQRGSAELNNKDTGFSFSEEDIVGTLTITETDEQISEGVVERSGFFDMINIGDQIFSFIPEEQEEDQAELQKPGRERKEEEEPESRFSPYPPARLYEDIIGIR